MPFDDNIFYATATRGEVAGVALKLSLAVGMIASALHDVKAGKDIDTRIADLQKLSDDLDKMFDALSGWRSE